MFGAPLGGTILGCHQGFDCATLRLTRPPNGRSGAGKTLPVIVRVAVVDPSALPFGVAVGPKPVACASAWAPLKSQDPPKAVSNAALAVETKSCLRFILLPR